ncbi:MAG: hypothetical protein IT161_02485, partial [Bryobacterales bacterium]|nr:hypothetical protein [Bryobacterales bacterium]
MPIDFGRPLPEPALEFKSWFGRWLARGPSTDEEAHAKQEESHPWYKVIWLTGVDYFSTLGYQPGIALLAAGALAPIATAILVLVTLLGALPVYAQVAKRSYAGQGSIAMLENLLSGWKSKIFVLILLGFAATDFVITMTLSSADAAKHAIENPFSHALLGDHQILVTLVLLVIMAVIFLIGFSEAIQLATLATVPYLFLNLIVLVRCLWEVLTHPSLIPDWSRALQLKGDPQTLALAAVIIFPKLALGLSGFETGVSVMPLIYGGKWDERRRRRDRPVPLGRIANTRKLLVTAALIMSFFLVLSSFVTALLISEADYAESGKAAGRAIAFLAHKYLGDWFGTVYDISTIVILGLAGMSAMAGLLHLIPRYLPRFGMAPLWVKLARPLVLVLLLINILVTLVFRADVEAQSGAYATGVLVLILSASAAATMASWRERNFLLSFYCGLVTIVFAYTLVDNCLERPDGLIIGSIFILLVMIISAISRAQRSVEFRVSRISVSEEGMRLSPSIRNKKVHLVPVRNNDPVSLARKKKEIKQHFSVEGPLAFVTVHLVDNRSEFTAEIELEARQEGPDFVIDVYGANTIANTIAYISELIDPISIFIGLTRANLMQQAFRYLLFGEGETGLMVYTILVSYWDWTPEEDVRPL